jgi:ribonuclease HII
MTLNKKAPTVKLVLEKPKTAKLYCQENNLNVYTHIAGVDEVGRGPLVGDVVAAAVILPENHGIEGLKDSKKIPEKKREALSDLIKERALAWAVGRASPAEIDEINILQASLLAMSRAVEALSVKADYALVDGNKLPSLKCLCSSVVKGDNRVEEIAAASIIAKVLRDEEMFCLDGYHPEYGFAQHKGYPTAHHMEMLKQHGVIPEHRKSFSPVRKIIEGQSDQSKNPSTRKT